MCEVALGSLPSGGSRKGSLPPPGLAAASSTPSPLGVPMSPLLVGSLDLGCLIRGETWTMAVREAVRATVREVCELGEQGPWKARFLL